MTIYTPGIIDKESKEDYPEVVTAESEPLTCKDKDDCEAAAEVVTTATKPNPVLRVTYFPRKKKSICCIHFVLTVMVMVFLACGVIGSVVFYRHLHRKASYSGVCGVRFNDPEYQELAGEDGFVETIEVADAAPEPPQQIINRYDKKKPQDGLIAKSSHYRVGFAEEGIEVSEVEKYEYLHMPFFDEVRETNVWHDFKTNYSAIIDAELGACYIMHLNRSAIAPPQNVIDMLMKTMSGYIKKYAQVIHQSYKVIRKLPELNEFGLRIKNRCESAGYESFFVKKYVTGVSKRSIDNNKALAYSMMNNFVENPQIYKIYIH